jgi:hypothetical protein
LGRGQEIVHTLTAAGLPCAVHGAIAGLIPYYEAEGIPFPWLAAVRTPQRGDPAAGHHAAGAAGSLRPCRRRARR